jgi:hypothetical protein
MSTSHISNLAHTLARFDALPCSKWHILKPIPREQPKGPTREWLPRFMVAFIPRCWCCVVFEILDGVGFNKCLHVGRPPPPGMLENSELAANSRKKEYSVSLPLCLAGFWLIKGGVGVGEEGPHHTQKKKKPQHQQRTHHPPTQSPKDPSHSFLREFAATSDFSSIPGGGGRPTCRLLLKPTRSIMSSASLRERLGIKATFSGGSLSRVGALGFSRGIGLRMCHFGPWPKWHAPHYYPKAG